MRTTFLLLAALNLAAFAVTGLFASLAVAGSLTTVACLWGGDEDEADECEA